MIRHTITKNNEQYSTAPSSRPSHVARKTIHLPWKGGVFFRPRDSGHSVRDHVGSCSLCTLLENRTSDFLFFFFFLFFLSFLFCFVCGVRDFVLFCFIFVFVFCFKLETDLMVLFFFFPLSWSILMYPNNRTVRSIHVFIIFKDPLQLFKFSKIYNSTFLPDSYILVLLLSFLLLL